ncbi:MAG: methylmalonyl-CoA mutase family protein, partial [Desulfatiglandales bacterium]|nr:methylmalonyl-CoA mutase family protein [Desulfatiglandales bacterium]
MDEKQTAKIKSTYLDGEQVPNFKTLSGLEYKEVYTSEDATSPRELPGVYPFTRGIHKTMYRGRLWTRRQQSGYRSARESNERIKYLLSVGQTGINMDPDLPTHLALDPENPLARGDVGLQGSSLVTYEDVVELYRDIPLGRVSNTMIIEAPSSAVIVAQYLLLAGERGIPWEKLIGTIMNCPLTQFVGPTFQANTTFFSIEYAIKIALDVMEYMVLRAPKWNIVNINAYNIRETGVNATQEAAFALAVAQEYVKGLIDRGLEVDRFAPRIGFFSAIHMDFFEEVAKLRAMRRIWARIMKEKFGAQNERSMWFRTACQTSALPLTAQEPLNNLVRAGVQTLAAVLGGVQSIHTTGYDEALSLPTEESHKLSVRTQQIIGYETGVVKSVDPLGGSYLIERLTDELEEQIWELLKVIEDRGGFLQCFLDRWVEDQITEKRYQFGEDLESGQQPMVGVNIFRDEEDPTDIKIFRHSEEWQVQRIQQILDYKKERPKEPVQRALGRLESGVRKSPEENCFEAIMKAVEARATLGEIIDALRRAIDFT